MCSHAVSSLPLVSSSAWARRRSALGTFVLGAVTPQEHCAGAPAPRGSAPCTCCRPHRQTASSGWAGTTVVELLLIVRHPGVRTKDTTRKSTSRAAQRATCGSPTRARTRGEAVGAKTRSSHVPRRRAARVASAGANQRHSEKEQSRAAQRATFGSRTRAGTWIWTSKRAKRRVAPRHSRERLRMPVAPTRIASSSPYASIGASGSLQRARAAENCVPLSNPKTTTYRGILLPSCGVAAVAPGLLLQNAPSSASGPLPLLTSTRAKFIFRSAFPAPTTHR